MGLGHGGVLAPDVREPRASPPASARLFGCHYCGGRLEVLPYPTPGPAPAFAKMTSRPFPNGVPRCPT